MWGNGKPVMREMKNTQDGAQASWFKVTVSILKKVWTAKERSQELCWSHVEMLVYFAGDSF